MDLEETKVRLTAGAKERIAALVGTYGMAGFIRRAVDDAIRAAEDERGAGKPAGKPQAAERARATSRKPPKTP